MAPGANLEHEAKSGPGCCRFDFDGPGHDLWKRCARAMVLTQGAGFLLGETCWGCGKMGILYEGRNKILINFTKKMFMENNLVSKRKWSVARRESHMARVEKIKNRTEKYCPRCDTIKAKSAFYKSMKARDLDGTYHMCAECAAKAAKARHVVYRESWPTYHGKHGLTQREMSNTIKRQCIAEANDTYLKDLLSKQLGVRLNLLELPAEELEQLLEIKRNALLIKRAAKLNPADPLELRKLCKGCNTEKPLSLFSPNSRMTLGVQTHCKKCCTDKVHPKENKMKYRSSQVYDRAMSVAKDVLEDKVSIRKAHAHARNLEIVPKMAVVDLGYAIARGEVPDIEFLNKPKRRTAGFDKKAKELALEVLAN